MKTALVLTCALALTGVTVGAAVAGSCGSSKNHASAASHSSNDIVDIASSAGTFKTLTAALTAADLVDVLKGDGPFTVFAPTDEAFARLPKGTVESLLLPENRHQLVDILKYHVVSGRVLAADAVGAKKANTVEGTKVRFSIDDGRLFVNNAAIIGTDIEADNGVIHVIDSVLLPN